MLEIRNGIPVLGQRVAVYMNLNKKGVFSILDKHPKSSTYGKVLAYSESVTLTQAKAHITQSKYESIHKSKRRAVCAVFVGELAAVGQDKPESLDVEVTYNPYRQRDFHTTEGQIIEQADLIHFENKRGWISQEVLVWQ